MREEATSSNDSFITELRDSGAPEINLVSRMGMYKAKEVDRYITHLQDQLSGTTAVYQDRFEEMRTSLLGMTRERDEKIAQIRVLEQRLDDSQDLDRALKAKGLVSLPEPELEQLRLENERMTLKVDQLTAQVKDNTEKTLLLEELQRTQAQLETRTTAFGLLEQELVKLKTQRNELQLTLDELQKTIEFLTEDRDKALEKFAELSESYGQMDAALQTRSQEANELHIQVEAQDNLISELQDELLTTQERYKAKTDQLSELEQHLASKDQAVGENKLQMDSLHLKLANLTESLAQSRAQYQLLDEQNHMNQELTNRLQAEKNQLDTSLRAQQQRWETQKLELVNRFQNILNSQNEFLKKWQTNFSTSFRYMESLSETDLASLLDTNYEMTLEPIDTDEPPEFPGD